VLQAGRLTLLECSGFDLLRCVLQDIAKFIDPTLAIVVLGLFWELCDVTVECIRL
jgi:hypothetical protein